MQFAELADFLRGLTPDDAPFELTIGYGPTVTAHFGTTYSSVDGSPFWYVVGRFGKFEDTDAEPGVDRTSVDAAVAAALLHLGLDLLVVRGYLEVVDPRGDVT